MIRRLAIPMVAAALAHRRAGLERVGLICCESGGGPGPAGA
jgi:hypothetical protein